MCRWIIYCGRSTGSWISAAYASIWRRSRRTGIGGFAAAIWSGICSKKSWRGALPKGWAAADAASRATQEYLDTLDDAAFGAATPVKPKAISPADPAARLTGANGDRPVFADSTNYLVDLDHAFIVDVQATAPIRQAEVGAVRNMLVRTQKRFNLHPGILTADTAYGAADMLGWLVEEQTMEPHFPVFGTAALPAEATSSEIRHH